MKESSLRVDRLTVVNVCQAVATSKPEAIWIDHCHSRSGNVALRELRRYQLIKKGLQVLGGSAAATSD